MQNLWLANAGGYLNGNTWNVPQGTNRSTPIGLLSARYNTSSNAYNDLTQNFPVADSIPNDDVIEAVIYKFAKMIFNNLNDNYLVGHNNNNKINAIKYFAYRLSRSIVVVKDSIFVAPLPKEFSDEMVANYKTDNNNNFEKIHSETNDPARLFSNIAVNYERDANLNDRQNSATYCVNSQPLTIALTTTFRTAFTKMMNKAILTRHFNRDNEEFFTFGDVAKKINAKKNTNDYNKLSPEQLIDKHDYITGCTGKCKLLVKLDVSDILTMKYRSSDFYFMDYIRNALDTTRNIIKYNFDFDNNNTYRNCAAGLVQVENINYPSIVNVGEYMNDTVLISKASFLNRLQNIDNQVEKNKIFEYEITKKRILAEIMPMIQNIIFAIRNNQPYKANAAFASLIVYIRGAINDYKNIYEIYSEENDRITSQLLELNQLLESEKDIDYASLEVRITKLYDRKQKILNEFNKKYEDVVPKVVISVHELRDVKRRLEDPNQFQELDEGQKKGLATKIGEITDRLIRMAEIEIPGIVSDILDRKEIDQLADLEPYMKYFLADPNLRGGVWIPIKIILSISTMIEEKTFFPEKYIIFNIFTGEIKKITSSTDFTNIANFKGKILVSATRSTNSWYYYTEKPDISKLGETTSYSDKMDYLKNYRKRFFEKYGQLGFFDRIGKDWVKKALYTAGANISLGRIRGNPVENCKENDRACNGFIYFDMLTKKILQIIKEEEKKVQPKKLYEKVAKSKNIELEDKLIAPTYKILGGKKTYSKSIIL
jgi:hypothetical protein